MPPAFSTLYEVHIVRIGGLQINGPNEQLLVLPRGEGNVVFRARAILDWEPFYKACPEPLPPAKLTPKGKEVDLRDKDYLVAKEQHEKRKLAWLVLKTLEPSEIEWDTVKMEKDSTWCNYSKDLQNSGFSPVEINRIIGLVEECNCLNEDKLNWARNSFVAGQQTSQLA